LVDTVQRESGYMSLPLRDEPASATSSPFRMQLEIPRGTRGVYVGGDHLDTHHLLLARDTTYRITGVDHDNGTTVIQARVEPRPDHAPEDQIVQVRKDIAESEDSAARLRQSVRRSPARA